ncbi:DNA repair protein [Neofusicoccum parvum]|nr:DNA repair protein [Neofusicoccum parvum]
MSDLHHVLPDGFPAHHFSHLLPSLDRHRVTTSDILTLDAADVAKRAQVPVAELRKLHHAIVSALHGQLGVAEGPTEPGGADTAPSVISDWHAVEWHTISTLDDRLDAELGGGIPTGYLTEITGESGAGKTQFLLTLLLSTQLPAPHGLSKSAIYISTEAPLATTRLTQLLQQHPHLSALPPSSKPSLSRILGIQTPDLEYQDHVLRYQLPVAIQRHNVGLVVLDSVAANYRAEFERPERDNRAGGAAMAERSAALVQLGALLRSIAHTHNVAVVVANQVADRFTPQQQQQQQQQPPASTATSRQTSYTTGSQGGGGGGGGGPSRHASDNSNTTARVPTPNPSQGATAPLISPDPLTLDHQQRWFTGWGDVRGPSADHSLKTPSLGLVWTNQIAARVALLKAPVYGAPGAWVGLAADGRADWREEGGNEREVKRWRRWMKVAFAAWAAPSDGNGVEFGILGRGVAAKASLEEGKGKEEHEQSGQKEEDDQSGWR